jgi:xylulokinase
MTEEAKDIQPGSEGLIFLPYLIGERTPYPDPDAKGVFFGLSLRHKKAHLIRAVMEGVTYGLRDSLMLIKDLKLPIKEIRCSGGGARSRLWTKIQADINDMDMKTVNNTEGAAFGCALLAGVGIKAYNSVYEACDKTIEVISTIESDENNVRLYNEYYKIYRSLYPILKDRFKELSNIEG